MFRLQGALFLQHLPLSDAAELAETTRASDKVEEVLMRWSRLYALRDLPVRKVVIPAAILVPLIAVIFDVVAQLQKQAETAPALQLEKTLAVLKLAYNPLLFWYYIAFLFYFAFVFVVDLFVPETVKKYRDADNFVLMSAESIKKLLNINGYTEKGAAVHEAIVDAANEQWRLIDERLSLVRLFSVVMLIVPVAIILFAVLVYVPGKIIQHDRFPRLLEDFFLFWKAGRPL